VESLSQENKVRRVSNCQITAENPIIAAEGSTANVPTQKRREDAEEVLYLKRI
jgi:hypothetical protein